MPQSVQIVGQVHRSRRSWERFFWSQGAWTPFKRRPRRTDTADTQRTTFTPPFRNGSSCFCDLCIGMPLWYVTGNELATQTGPADAAENPGNPGIPASSKGTVVAELSASSKGTVVAELSSRQLSGKTRQLPGKTSYAPIKQPCPVAKVPVVREIGANYALSQAEIDFLKLRAPIVKAAWEKYLNNVKVGSISVLISVECMYS